MTDPREILPAGCFPRGAVVRVAGRLGRWVVVRDSGGGLVIVRRGRETTSAARTNITATKGKTK